jgi:2-polyprenyl-3-methyl-5-hydroxy-6-metoxy-1,4-benzoquinol methylase
MEAHMKELEKKVGGGHYARKQLLCKSSIISWSHSSRFRLARKLVDPHAGKAMLDYGCGDGTFLALVSDLFPSAVGADIDERQAEDCRQRLGSVAQMSFLLTGQLSDSRYDGAFDVVVCMETLEHCAGRIVDDVLDDLRRLVRPDGVVIISVPIETGLVLPLKQLTRRVAGWRRLGDYRYNERYSAAELVKMVFASGTTTIARPKYYGEPGNEKSAYHGHKGFNWRWLRRKLQDYLMVAETRFSPLAWSRGMLSSQAWFICNLFPKS